MDGLLLWIYSIKPLLIHLVKATHAWYHQLFFAYFKVPSTIFLLILRGAIFWVEFPVCNT